DPPLHGRRGEAADCGVTLRLRRLLLGEGISGDRVGGGGGVGLPLKLIKFARSGLGWVELGQREGRIRPWSSGGRFPQNRPIYMILLQTRASQSQSITLGTGTTEPRAKTSGIPHLG